MYHTVVSHQIFCYEFIFRRINLISNCQSYKNLLFRCLRHLKKLCDAHDLKKHVNTYRVCNLTCFFLSFIYEHVISETNKALGNHLSKLVREGTLSIQEGRAEGFYKFFKKYFVAQETIDLNISWPINFFRKYFMAPSYSSFLFKAYL